MATCKCGNKKGWNDWECTECMNKKAIEVNAEHLESLKESHPALYEYCKKYNLSGGEFSGAFLDELNDVNVLHFAGGAFKLVLTDSELIKWEMTLLTGRVKQKEIIPLHTITGIESWPPRGADLSLWKMRITRAANVDEVYMQEGANVRPFIDALNAAVNSAASGGKSSSGPSIADKVKSLAELKDAGLLTEEEFAEKKAQLLKDL